MLLHQHFPRTGINKVNFILFKLNLFCAGETVTPVVKLRYCRYLLFGWKLWWKEKFWLFSINLTQFSFLFLSLIRINISWQYIPTFGAFFSSSTGWWSLCPHPPCGTPLFRPPAPRSPPSSSGKWLAYLKEEKLNQFLFSFWQAEMEKEVAEMQTYVFLLSPQRRFSWRTKTQVLTVSNI